MQSQTIQQKQKFLRDEIIGKQVDPQEFMQFMGRVKDQGDNIDLENWSMKELKGIVEKYREYINKSKQELMSSRFSRDLRKTKIFESSKKEKFKYEGTNLWDYEQNYQQECSKSELAFEFPPDVAPRIQVQKWDLKSVGGFIFGIGSRNELELTISSNFTPGKVVRKVEDTDWLKVILTLRHSGSFVPPLEPSREFATDDKKGINAKVVEVTRFLNSLLDYPVFRYSTYFKEFMTQPNYKKFNQYKNRESQFAKEKDILEIQSPSGHFNVQISQKMVQTLKKSSQLTQEITGLFSELNHCVGKLSTDLDNVGKGMRSLNEITAKLGEKYNQVQNYFNYKDMKLPTIFLSINNTGAILMKNLRLNAKALYDFNESYIKNAVKDWNEFLTFDRRHQGEFKTYLSNKENLLRRKEKFYTEPTKWQLPQADFLKYQRMGVNKMTKEEAFEKMFPNDNQLEGQARIWLSFANQNYLASFKQFLVCQEQALLADYQAYTDKYLSFSTQVRQTFENFREIVGVDA